MLCEVMGRDHFPRRFLGTSLLSPIIHQVLGATAPRKSTQHAGQLLQVALALAQSISKNVDPAPLIPPLYPAPLLPHFVFSSFLHHHPFSRSHIAGTFENLSKPNVFKPVPICPLLKPCERSIGLQLDTLKL